ncbi:MAG: epoxide hydrolase [Gammaproteobacteria bacterium]|nr:epoxide hydrolase [Gammaproteobacteria bacterium]
MQATPFHPTLSDESLTLLRERLKATRWPAVIGADDWIYGVPQHFMRDMRDWWLEEWDWNTVAADIRRYPHYRVDIEGIPIHFIHAKARRGAGIPLILTHGWPWTFRDFKDVIEPLLNPSDPTQPAFDVVIPSLPGFGFSLPLNTSGVDVARIAALWVTLMTRVLGYPRFAAHGGDWGALITAHLAHAHAEHLIGAHMGLTLIPGVNRDAATFAEDERWMQARNAESLPTIQSHVAVHRLDPQTLAYGLMDSPIATAAWIWERRRNWSDCNGEVESAFSREHLCTTAALYWCTGAITSSLRIYFEHFNKPWPLAHDRGPRLEAPCAFAVFPKDVVHMPRATLAEHANLKRYTRMARGGHFGAAEAPDLLVDDLRAFFGSDL